MLIFEHIKAIQAFLSEKNQKIGFVPTMGALHQGHLSLIEKAKAENEGCVCSIFVNPTQFNNAQDLQLYPRTIEADIELLEKAGCDVLFLPSVTEMYPAQPALKFDFGTLEAVMEGKNRPGHFNGVAIVVSKLFHIIQPQKAYFGQKDWQQYLILKQLVQDLAFNITLIPCPIIREENGLAMSSRNKRLNALQYRQASVLYQALQQVQKLYQEKKTLPDIQQQILHYLRQQAGITVEYFEIADAYTLQPISEDATEPSSLIACLAAKLGDVRLIDNMLLS